MSKIIIVDSDVEKKSNNSGLVIACIGLLLLIYGLGNQGQDSKPTNGAVQPPVAAVPEPVNGESPPLTKPVDLTPVQPQEKEEEILPSSRPAPCQSVACEVAFQEFLASATNSAFVVGSNGVWAWKENDSQLALAESQALLECTEIGGENCHLAASKSVQGQQ